MELDLCPHLSRCAGKIPRLQIPNPWAPHPPFPALPTLKESLKSLWIWIPSPSWSGPRVWPQTQRKVKKNPWKFPWEFPEAGDLQLPSFFPLFFIPHLCQGGISFPLNPQPGIINWKGVFRGGFFSLLFRCFLRLKKQAKRKSGIRPEFCLSVGWGNGVFPSGNVGFGD